MKHFKNVSKPCILVFQLFVLGLAMVFSIGCYQDATAPTGPAQLLKTGGQTVARPGDTSQCNTVSGILLPGDSLKLSLGVSKVKYRVGTVSVPTPVSFSICRLDTTGTPLRPMVAVFGPFSNLVFLQGFDVQLSLADVGLPTATPIRGYFKLFRLNEVSGEWDSVKVGRINGVNLKYSINRNGTYAITFDTTWVASSVISPAGGTLSLFCSIITFPAGALRDSTLVSFRITTGVTPVGLPGATDQVFDFEPEGIVFQVPVTLRVSFADAGINEEEDKVAPLRCYYFNPTTSAWEPQPTAIDWQSQLFVVTLSHFSRYAFGR
ncbi:MAG: hypothetical protein HW412_998 [Bacteroidetes bacterium]|nr:hypothetical protein [Bacteroidota bacterium]